MLFWIRSKTMFVFILLKHFVSKAGFFYTFLSGKLTHSLECSWDRKVFENYTFSHTEKFVYVKLAYSNILLRGEKLKASIGKFLNIITKNIWLLGLVAGKVWIAAYLSCCFLTQFWFGHCQWEDTWLCQCSCCVQVCHLHF